MPFSTSSSVEGAFCADVESSSEDYARRFSGSHGEWLLSVQLRGVETLLGDLHRQTILDLGGGHAQLAEPLSMRGAALTVLGSQASCAERLKSWLASGRGKFVVGNLLHTPFGDRQFDTVVAVRMISHCDSWPDLITELCRVAKCQIVIDYPPLSSFNLFYGFFFSLKKRIEGNTRSFLVFRTSQLEAEFAKHGFVKVAEYKQFFVPMVAHRAIKSVAISKCVEGLCRMLGLTALFGSPSLIKLERRT